MRTHIAIAALLAVGLAVTDSSAQSDQEPFRPLFNGKNLDGWVPVNTAPSTWNVADGLLVCSGKPIGELRTEKMYQNFILELEWRHMKPRGNAGVFVWADDITARGVPFHRSIEVQVLENAYGNTRSHTTHGDIFPIHGAKMVPINGRRGSRAFPTENRSKPSPEWNHYRIECRDGTISLAVNGKVVTRGKECSPRKGYICLESEGGIVHYRNLRIYDLPDTPIEPQHVAIENRGYRCLYNGVDLDGWQVTGDGWESRDWVLAYTGGEGGSLKTTESYGDVGFIFDVRLKDTDHPPIVDVRGAKIIVDPKDETLANKLGGGRGWNRFEGELYGDRLTLRVNGSVVCAGKQVSAADKGELQVLSSGPVDFSNIYVRELK